MSKQSPIGFVCFSDMAGPRSPILQKGDSLGGKELAQIT